MKLITAGMQTAGLEPSCEPETPEMRIQRSVDSYNAGKGTLDQEDGYCCTICNNKGYVAYMGEKDAFGYPTEYFKPCKCCKIRNAIRRLSRSGLKDVVKKYTFDRFEATEPWQQTIKARAERYCQEGCKDWFFIGGQSGSGKTHICTAAAVAAIKQGKEVCYMVWRDEAPKIKAIVNDADAYCSKMRELKEADVLYIDDLFKSGQDDDGKYKPPTAADVNLAFEIINYRYNSPKLVTIISSERTLDELNDIDEATAGRIAERSKPNGYCFSVKRDKSRNWRMRGIMEL